MRKSAVLFAFIAVFLTAVFWSVPAAGQTAATGAVLGTVTDPGGAVAPGVAVELTNTATNEARSMESNSSGQYVFANLNPGTYNLKFTKSGFSTGTISNIRVDVNKTLTYDIRLEISKGKEVVEVVATAQAELQTSDAQVGNEVSSDAMLKLPTLRRNAAALLTLQPGVAPGNNSFPRVGMRVAGAIDDQNVFTVDGIDVSDNVIGGIDAQTIASIPLGVESIEEYRVGVNNPNATFGRASGGQIGAVSKSGSNSFHGAGYFFHQNSAFNANEWELNSIGVPTPKFHDNRFGGKVGGPIWKNHTFFFFDYEGRRFPSASTFNRLMPTNALRSGALQFSDCSSGQFDAKGNCSGGGTVRSYNLASSKLCGDGTMACDPRGIGISPSVQALWNLDPQGNAPTNGADGLNNLSFTGTAVTPLKTNFYDGRIDHEITKKWHFNGSYIYYQTLVTSGGQGAQYDLRGGTPKATSQAPTDRDAVIAGVTGQITPNLINTFRFGWVRDRESFDRLAPSATAALEAIPGTNSAAGFIALAPALAAATTNALVDAPIEVDTQRARFQNITGRNIQYIDDVSWIKGTHTMQFGGNIRHIPTLHIRNDKVVGSLASLEVLSDADVSTFLSSIPSSERPPTCAPASNGSPAVTTNCINPSDIQRWDRLYASTLGLVDNIGILTTRDGSLKPLPFGTPLINDTTLNAFEFYGQDTWRIKPNLTLTYGLSYGWQTPPHEKLNRQTLVVDAATLKSLTGPGYIAAKEAAALAGQTFNPTLGFEPVKAAHRTVFNTDYGDVAPRVAVAWTPDFSSGFLHTLASGRKTVIRGGYSIVYDRENTVQTVIIPMLGVGFAQTITVGAPLCNASGTPGAGCNFAAGKANPGAASFRVGVDGNLPLPTVPAVSQPVVPGPFGELFSFQDDPNVKVGRSHAFDLTVQRQLPADMILEVGWIGRWSDRLPQGVNFNSAPYFFVDPASKQNFATAYDAVAAALAAGQKPASLAAQPFFENQLPFAAIQALGGPCAQKLGGATNTTQFLASAAAATFTSGLVNSLFSQMDGLRTCLGLPNYQNQQLFDLHMRTYIGKSNYNGLIVTLRKRTSHGLTFDASYTLSKTLDQNISNQNQAGIYSNSYHPNVDYGPSLFDRRHIFNFNYLYELPFGKGHRFGNGNLSSRLLGGFYTSGIFSAFSGLPLFVTESSQVWGGGTIFGFAVGQIPLVNPSSFGDGRHDTVCSSGATASAGNGPNCGAGDKGTGLNLFSDPAKVFSEFRNVQISKDGRTGRANPLIGLGFWNLDMSIGKKTAITERLSMSLSADFFNIFNHPNFQDPTLNISSASSFGVLGTQLIPTNRDTAGARWIQLGLRVDF